MLKGIGILWRKHCRDNLWIYLIVLFCLLIGVVIGATTVKLLSAEETLELGEYLAVFVNKLQEFDAEQFSIARHSFYKNFKTLGLIWFLGLTVLGAPLILILLLAEGFTLGFTAGFLIQEKGLEGFFLALMSLTPPNIFLLPALITAGVVGITFSLWLVKGRFQFREGGIVQQFFAYSFSILFLGSLLVGAGVMEVYCSPLLMKWVITYFN